jgi:transposase
MSRPLNELLAAHVKAIWSSLASARSQLAGERAAVLMTLIESAKLNGHAPWAYLKDVFERLPTLKNRGLAQLLPHNWHPASAIAKTSTLATTATA